MYRLSYPAFTGETITQGHADYCAANGHATLTENGVVGTFCPRCGDSLAQASTKPAAIKGNTMFDTKHLADGTVIVTDSDTPNTRSDVWCVMLETSTVCDKGETHWEAIDIDGSDSHVISGIYADDAETAVAEYLGMI